MKLTLRGRTFFFLILFYLMISYILLAALRALVTGLLFEEIIIAGFLSLLVCVLATFALFEHNRASIKKILVALFIGFQFYAFITPNMLLNIDRSRSFYVLGWIHKQEIQHINQGLELSQVGSPESANIKGVLDRVREQQSRGLVGISNNTYFLTTRGEIMFGMANILARIFNLNGWFENNH